MSNFDLPRTYLSPSQLNTYLRCGLLYYFRYILGLTRPPGIAAYHGTALHRVNERYYNDKIDKLDLFTPAEAADIAMAEFEKATDEEGVSVSGSAKDETAVILAAATRSYIENVAVDIEPIETEMEIWYSSACGVDVKGYVDLVRHPYDWEVAQYGDSAKQVIVDYKLSKSKWGLPKLTNSLQFMIYTMATGNPIVEVQNVTQSKNSRKCKVADRSGSIVDLASNVRLLRHRFDGSEFEHIENLIERVASSISAGNFLPCSPDNWCCSSQWCGFWNMCRGKGYKTP